MADGALIDYGYNEFLAEKLMYVPGAHRSQP
jgi:hypothetical protein